MLPDREATWDAWHQRPQANFWGSVCEEACHLLRSIPVEPKP